MKHETGATFVNHRAEQVALALRDMLDGYACRDAEALRRAAARYRQLVEDCEASIAVLQRGGDK